jgi:hypothetical protein
MIDNEGKYNYSEVRSLTFDDIKNIFSVTPNPAKDKVILTVKGNKKTLQVKLFNAVGQQVASYILAGETLTMDVSRLNTGAYYISITGEGINQKEKLVIQ